jgi:hypothetical protein
VKKEREDSLWQPQRVPHVYIKDRVALWHEPVGAISQRDVGSGSPIVAMMKPSQSRVRKYPTGSDGASSTVRCALPEPQMSTVLVVIANILREQPLQMAFINCDDVVQQVTTTTANPTFRNSILPRTFERSSDRTHFQ